ncbi:uncharacterized protein LOC112575179 [Pomacea canaliculata]|uniref:uncharacterized protein LOC112575179 n=1 Tax=Pomacea canaliculata TaxID=400727 RepID=UPI000D73BA70|nr:uncharacterized protein LOC112575179 [Pomacea canaliculata]
MRALSHMRRLAVEQTSHVPSKKIFKRQAETFLFTNSLALQNKQAVAECFWKERQPQCWAENGYIFDYSHLTLWIPEVTSEKDGNYSCWHATSNAEEQKTCLLDVTGKGLLMEYTVQRADQLDNTALAVGLTLPILALLATATVLIVKNKKKVLSWISTCRHREEEPEGAKEDVSLTNDPDYQMITKRFQEYLESQTQSMFPNMLQKHSFYFVPPVYFNKTRYRKEIYYGQAVFVPEPVDAKDVRYDQAMLHVFTCLHDMAKHDKKNMFVLTQFKYDDYLKNLGSEFQRHRLPVPAGFTEENQNIQCFDLMIVHRHHGVLVGVVKAVGDKVIQDDQQPLNDMIVKEVTDAVKQLKKGADMIKHLMSDQEQSPRVCQTLMLPNMARTTLQRVIADQPGLVQGMRECLGKNEVSDPTELCLCAEDLENPRMLSDVISRMLTSNNTEDGVPMTDELYIRILSRFCGPATQSALEGQCQSMYLPKTQVEAVSVTGDLYRRPILSEDMLDLLTKERLFLVGPPNTATEAGWRELASKRSRCFCCQRTLWFT